MSGAATVQDGAAGAGLAVGDGMPDGSGAAGQGDRGPVPRDYESAVAELESLVERMEDGRLALEESLSAYQRGVDLVRFCREQLAAVEQRVRILEAGLLQPFEADAAVSGVPGDEEEP
jgi:exodeoxyribonuclease VII small subunit